MHEYPLFNGSIDQLEWNGADKGKDMREVIKHLDGVECLDSVCCAVALTRKEIISIPNVIIIYK